MKMYHVGPIQIGIYHISSRGKEYFKVFPSIKSMVIQFYQVVINVIKIS